MLQRIEADSAQAPRGVVAQKMSDKPVRRLMKGDCNQTGSSQIDIS